MEHFEILLRAFVATPLPALVVVLLLAVAWLIRDRFQMAAKREAELSAQRDAAVSAYNELQKLRFEDSRTILPLAEKMTTVISMLTTSRGA